MAGACFVPAAAAKANAAQRAVLDDAGELVGVEAGPADEGAVDVGLGHQLGDVGRLDRPAVLDAHGVGRVGRRTARPPPPGWRRTSAWASAAVAVRPVPMAQIGS